ncbi:putative F420-dependent oxidoreductase [Nocardia sp. GAS34]|uniref:TIGR03620 family F420-dependent LLM class oxidoreductase n=1 Tax=unclassified Nocardia TaxID=2637762 RepID=UPI003D1F1041
MDATLVEAARAAIGPVGIALPINFAAPPPLDLQRDAVRRLEAAGYRTAWTNEVPGKDALAQLSVLLAATGRMAFGTFIANVWVREPETAHAAAAVLAQAYPGRFVLGLGVGYPEQAAAVGRSFGSPLTTMRDYVARMDGPQRFLAPDVRYPRLIAALGPKMLALSGEVADGAMPAMLPPEFTAAAREALGPDKLLVTGLSIIPDTDPDRARQAAREALSGYLARPTMAAALTRLGYPDERPGAVSDRLVEASYGYGGPEAIAAKVREHLAAGSDHVTLLLPIGSDFATGIEQYLELAPALTELG